MEAVPKRLLLFAATTGYQIREFADAAHRLGLELTLATDHCDRMGDPWGDGVARWAAGPRIRGCGGGGRPAGGGGCGDRGNARHPVPSACRGASLPRYVPGAATLPGGGPAD